MERKIGEIFEYNGEWYQCVEGLYCDDCAFINYNCENRERIALREKLTKQPTTGFCNSEKRNDRKSVIFKKLEKVGEPYEHYGKLYQCYKLPMEIEIRLLPNNCYPIGKDNLVEIEIKQTKENMEEKKQKWGVSSDTINEINKGIEPMNTSRNIDTECSVAKDIRRNLKPFDLEAAKAGKPVCTRDGRTVRIIAFDAKRKNEENIIALVPSRDYPGFEDLIAYPNNGNYQGGHENDGDLMMYSEKKEGWAKVRKDINLYDTKEEADRKMIGNYEYVTAKVCWEE